jgi:hypothetical protein
MTEITNEQWTMLIYWTNMTPKIAAKELVANLKRRFSMPDAAAWVAVARFRNHQHTEAE